MTRITQTLSERSAFCKQCGALLESDTQFCPKCGSAVVSQTIQPTQPFTTSTFGSSGKIWGIDKRFIIVLGVIVLMLVLPVFPRQTTIYVDGQTTATQTYQSNSIQISYQTATATTPQTINVYTGTLQYLSSSYYNYYQQYYNACYVDVFGNVYCDYSYWPNYYSSYGSSATYTSSDEVVKVEQTQQSGGLWTMTLTKADGTSDTYQNVYSSNLSKNGVSAVDVSVVQTDTVTSTVAVPAITVSNVPCHQCIPEQVTERVSLLQILFGF